MNKTELSPNQTGDILENLADPLVAFDKQWRYTFVSHRAAQALGRLPQDLIGQSMWDLFPEDADIGFQQACEQAWANQESVILERYSKVLKAWIEIYICPFGNNASTQWRDISRRKHAESALRESELRHRTLFDSIDEGCPSTPSGSGSLRTEMARHRRGD